MLIIFSFNNSKLNKKCWLIDFDKCGQKSGDSWKQGNLERLHRSFVKEVGRMNIQPDEIDEQHPILILGMGRFGQIVNDLLRLSGYDTTVVDLDPTMIKGFNDYGIKSYFGDASRPEFFNCSRIGKG